MSVHERVLPSGRKVFEVRFRDGNRNRSKVFDLRKDAAAYDCALRRWRQAGDIAVELERRKVTVNDLYGMWLQRSMPALSAKAAENYATQLDLRILPEFGDRRVVGLRVADIELWISKMRTDGVGDPTVIKACTVLQALLSMAVRDDVVSANVVQQARKPPQRRSRTPYLIKPISVERMRAVMTSQRDIVLLDLLAYAGLRPESEAIKLRWRHVGDRSILVQDTKRGRERHVRMLEPLRQSLKAWRKDSDDELVVPAGDGAWSQDDWRNWRRRPFAKAAKTAGLPKDVRPRDLRGSFASLLVHEGRTIVDVAGQLGHSPAICLRDYAQLFSEDNGDRKDAQQVIAEARLAARIGSMRTWAEFAPRSHDPIEVPE